MASISIKEIRPGKYYRYLQWYEPGSRVPKSKYLGPVNPKRRRGGFLGGLTVPTFLVGAVLVGIKAARGELKTRTYRDRPVELLSLHRARQVAQKAIEGLDRKYAIDKTDAASFNASRARLPKEMQEEYQRAQMVAWKAVHTERERAQPPAPMSSDMKDFIAQVEQARAEQAGKSAAPSAPAASQAEAAEAGVSTESGEASS